MADKTIFLTSTGANTWTVPADWSSTNTVRCLGPGGGGGQAAGNNHSSGGGGGGYSEKSNIADWYPGQSVSYAVGAAGAVNTSGNDTWIGATVYANAVVGAKGGAKGTEGDSQAGGLGGQAADGIGTTKYSGGQGGTSAAGGGGGGRGGGGGGGAAGPHGNGGKGGVGEQGGSGAGGGGGGADGGTDANAFTGGNSRQGDTETNGAGGDGASTGTAEDGTAEEVWTQTSDSATAGPGGGAGSGNAVGAAGAYGGGGAGRCNGLNAGPGAQGLIVITYTPNVGTTQTCTVE